MPFALQCWLCEAAMKAATSYVNKRIQGGVSPGKHKIWNCDASCKMFASVVLPSGLQLPHEVIPGGQCRTKKTFQGAKLHGLTQS